MPARVSLAPRHGRGVRALLQRAVVPHWRAAPTIYCAHFSVEKALGAPLTPARYGDSVLRWAFQRTRLSVQARIGFYR